MNSPINWYDEYTNTEKRIVYTNEQIQIPGVRILAHHLMNNAVPSLDWHYHENAFEFTIATRGTITFSTQTASYQFSRGDVFVSFPNEIHGTNNTPITVGEIYWFQLDISDPNRFLFLKPEAARHMIELLKTIPHHVIQTEAKKAFPLLENAFRLVHNGSDPVLTATYLQLFLYLIVMYAQNEQPQLSPDIGRTLNYIREHITDTLSLEELADVANLSCSQFKQKFRKQVGSSPRHYVNQQKVEYSKAMLLNGMSVTEIAMLLNFTTSSYFSNVFKKYTMYTPREYVRTHSKPN